MNCVAICALLLALAGAQQSAEPAAANIRAGRSQLPETPFRIAGVVVDMLSGQVLAGATVSITKVGSPEPPEIVSIGGDGGFAFENVAPGKYSLLSRHKGYLMQTYKEHESFSTAIIVGPGLDTEHLRFEMRPGGSISGQITDESNEPVRRAQVGLWRQAFRDGKRGTGRYSTAISDDQGHYFLGDLPEGTYFLSVSGTPWYADHNLVQEPNASSSSEEAEFQPRTDPMLDDGSDAGIGFTQEMRGDVVELRGIPPGTVRIRIGDPTGRDPAIRSEIVQLTSSQEIAAPDSSDAVSITGSMRMDDGSPLQLPATLWLQSPGREQISTARANSGGTLNFTERNISPGAYEVSLPEPRGCVITSLTATGAKVQGRSVEFVAGQNAQLNVVISKGAAKVRGFTLKDGKPVDGVKVVLAPEDAAHNAVLFRRDQSDSDGSFDIEIVVPGKYTAIAIEDGWDLAWSDAAVLKRYLAAGEKLLVAPNGSYDLKLNVQ